MEKREGSKNIPGWEQHLRTRHAPGTLINHQLKRKFMSIFILFSRGTAEIKMNWCYLSLWNPIPALSQTTAANNVCSALFSEGCSHRLLPQAPQNTSCRVQSAAAAWMLSPLSRDSSGSKLSLGKISNTSQGKNDSSWTAGSRGPKIGLGIVHLLPKSWDKYPTRPWLLFICAQLVSSEHGCNAWGY